MQPTGALSNIGILQEHVELQLHSKRENSFDFMMVSLINFIENAITHTVDMYLNKINNECNEDVESTENHIYLSKPTTFMHLCMQEVSQVFVCGMRSCISVAQHYTEICFSW